MLTLKTRKQINNIDDMVVSIIIVTVEPRNRIDSERRKILLGH